MICSPQPREGTFHLLSMQDAENPIRDSLSYPSLDVCSRALFQQSSNFSARIFSDQSDKRPFFKRVQRSLSKWPIVGRFFARRLRKIRPKTSPIFNIARNLESRPIEFNKNQSIKNIAEKLRKEKYPWLTARIVAKKLNIDSHRLEAVTDSNILNQRLKNLPSQDSFKQREGLLVRDYRELKENAQILNLKTLDYFHMLREAIPKESSHRFEMADEYYNELEEFIQQH